LITADEYTWDLDSQAALASASGSLGIFDQLMTTSSFFDHAFDASWSGSGTSDGSSVVASLVELAGDLAVVARELIKMWIGEMSCTDQN
jgi:hypothetical protein